MNRHKKQTFVHGLLRRHHQVIYLKLTGIIGFIDITGRKREIKYYLEEISCAVENANDVNLLDRIRTLLMQAASSSNACTTDDNTHSFKIPTNSEK